MLTTPKPAPGIRVVAITISSTAITRWLDATDERPLVAHIREVRQPVTDLTADTTGWPAPAGALP